MKRLLKNRVYTPCEKTSTGQFSLPGFVNCLIAANLFLWFQRNHFELKPIWKQMLFNLNLGGLVLIRKQLIPEPMRLHGIRSRGGHQGMTS